MHSIKYSVFCRAFNSNLYSIRYMQGISRGRRISDKEGGGVGVPDGVRSAG